MRTVARVRGPARNMNVETCFGADTRLPAVRVDVERWMLDVSRGMRGRGARGHVPFLSLRVSSGDVSEL